MKTDTIKKGILIQATPEFVFDKLIRSEDIVKYFPLKEVISDWNVGCEVLYKGEIDGQPFTDFGRIECLDRPKRYHYTYWSDNHGTERTPENHVSIRYQLSSKGKGTHLLLEQGNLPSEEMFKLMDAIVWDSLLDSMRAYIESEFRKNVV